MTDRSSVVHANCNCIGPQNGEPYCPCQMRQRGVFIRNGRFIEPEKDLGKVPAFTWNPGGFTTSKNHTGESDL